MMHVILLELYIKYDFHAHWDDDACNNLDRKHVRIEVVIAILHLV